jgi:PAS domain S-box-containing protein
MGTVQRSQPGTSVEIPGHDNALLLEGENELLRLIIEGTPLPVVLQELARVAEHYGSPGLLAPIFLVEKDGQHLRIAAAPGFPAAFGQEVGRIAIGVKSGPFGEAGFRRAPVLIVDTTSHELGPEFRDFAAKFRLRACWSMPIMSSREALLGVFALCYQDPATPTDSDRLMLEMLARTGALAIERSQTERDLTESEERLRSLSRCSPIGIFTTSVERTFTFVNPRFREISGFGYEKTVEYWLENAVDADHRAKVVARWTGSVAGRLEFSEEFPVPTDAGVLRWVNLRAAPMKSSVGEHIGYVGTVEDVSERRRAESDLRSESAFRQAIEESIPCGIVTCNLDGRRTYVNRAFAEMMGCSPEELISEAAPFKNWPPDQREKIHELFLEVLSGRVPKDGVELNFQRRSGELFTVLLTFSELLDGSHQRCGWVAAVLDITERKRVEESLRESEARLTLALDVGKMGAWEWDILHNTIRWSPQIERIHGLQPGAFGGTFDDFHKDMNPDHRSGVFRAIEEAIRVRGAYHVEYEIIRPDGEHVWLEARGQVFSNERGEAIKMAGICMDITDRKAEENPAVARNSS